MLRRLGQRLPAVGRSDVVAWRDLHLISERGHTAQLATPRSAVHLLDARGLAVLISRLDTESATEVLAARGPTVAAQVIRASHPAVGYEAALDDPYREARTFYLTFGLVTVSGAVIILIPNAPLVTILVATQVLNAVLLIPLLFAMIGIGRDADLMGEFRIGRAGAMTYGVTTAVVVACVAALAVVSVWP